MDESKIICETCNSKINKREWSRHIKSKKHNRRPLKRIHFIFEKVIVSFD
jgi:hypothetical protein